MNSLNCTFFRFSITLTCPFLMNDGKPVAAGLYRRVELKIGKNIYTFYFQNVLLKSPCQMPWPQFCFHRWNKSCLWNGNEIKCSWNVHKKTSPLPWPGFEPGLLRPQRRVLTTRRSRQSSLGVPTHGIWGRKVTTALVVPEETGVFDPCCY